MKEKIYTSQDLVKMTKNEFIFFETCIRIKAYRLLGIDAEEWVTVEEGKLPGQELIIRWK